MSEVLVEVLRALPGTPPHEIDSAEHLADLLERIVSMPTAAAAPPAAVLFSSPGPSIP